MPIMISTALSKRNYSLIGRILYKTRPDVASQMEQVITPGPEADLQRIFFYYSRFDSIDLKGYNEVNRRRMFTAVMLHLYHPNCFVTGLINVKYGFVKNIAACFDCKSQSITRNIREVIVMDKCYEDFGEKVKEVLEHFKNVG